LNQHSIDIGFQTLKSTLQSLAPITIEEWAEFKEIWNVVEHPRKSNLTTPGQVERHTYFVLHGVQRIYHLSDNGKEATLVFTYEGDFGGILDSYLLQQPSKYYYETLTKSQFLRCNHDAFHSGQNKYKNIKTAMDILLYMGFSGTLTRLVDLQSLSSKKKFKKLLKRSPHILEKIPHKYLANYIGVDPTNFSKMINSIKAFEK